MYEFFIFFRNSIASISDMLNSFSFMIGSIPVRLFDLLLAFIALGIIISVFWKGARS